MPDSPVMRTVLFVFAIVSIILKTASIASLRPMMLQNSWLVFSARLSRTFSCLSRCASDVLPDLEAQLVHVERLGEVVHRPEPHGFDGAVGRGERRHHERDDVAIELLRGTQHFDAADVRHPDVGEQQIDALLLENRDRLGAVGCQQHIVAIAAKHDAQHVAHRRLIVHDEDARLGSALGRGSVVGLDLARARLADSYDRFLRFHRVIRRALNHGADAADW